MERFTTLPATALQFLRHYWKMLRVRVALFGLFACLALVLTQIVESLIPSEMARALPGESADRLLDLIANAMLAVTIFSLTVMVSVYRSSSSQWTPRVHLLIMQDPTTQNTLATFIGAFVYATVAIVLRELGIYNDDKAFTLFWMTVIVLGFVIWSLIRWVLHLQTLGSLIDTARQLEEMTRQQFEERFNTPCLGACALTGAVPDDTEEITADQTGYIQHVYPEALQSEAKAHGVEIFLPQEIGSFVFLNQPVAWWRPKGEATRDDGRDAEALAERVRKLIVVGDARTYDQDPRFGLTVLAEIGSKALSPGINDPGTAIDVLDRAARALSLYKDETADDRAPEFKRIHIPPISPNDLISDGFAGVVRDGAGVVEVQLRLQKILHGLLRHPDEGLRHAVQERGVEFLARALDALDWAQDADRLRDASDTKIVEALDKAGAA